MKPVFHISSKAFCIRTSNIDTDQIIPARFLKMTDKKGIGKFFFYHYRFDDSGKPKKDHAFIRGREEKREILIAGKNFGCGSSREHAVWAAQDFGIRAVISSSFGDIFHQNALKNGLIPVRVTESELEELFSIVESDHTKEIHIRLETQEVIVPNTNLTYRFPVDSFRKQMLLQGWDELKYLLAMKTKIAEFEKKHK